MLTGGTRRMFPARWVVIDPELQEPMRYVETTLHLTRSDLVSFVGRRMLKAVEQAADGYCRNLLCIDPDWCPPDDFALPELRVAQIMHSQEYMGTGGFAVGRIVRSEEGHSGYLLTTADGGVPRQEVEVPDQMPDVPSRMTGEQFAELVEHMGIYRTIRVYRWLLDLVLTHVRRDRKAPCR